MEITIILFLFLLGGALDGLRDAIMGLNTRGPDGECIFLHAFQWVFDRIRSRNFRRGFWRWFLSWIDWESSGNSRIKLGSMVNIPLDGWHVCKTLAYVCFGVATVLATLYCQTILDAWLGLVGVGVVRPVAQNITQWSCLYNKFTMRGF